MWCKRWWSFYVPAGQICSVPSHARPNWVVALEEALAYRDTNGQKNEAWQGFLYQHTIISRISCLRSLVHHLFPPLTTMGMPKLPRRPWSPWQYNNARRRLPHWLTNIQVRKFSIFYRQLPVVCAFWRDPGQQAVSPLNDYRPAEDCGSNKNWPSAEYE